MCAPFPRLGFWLSNCGRRAFSEPETQAIRDFMKELDNNHDFSFYVNCHTALHMIYTPWISYKPPFKMTSQEKNVLAYVVDWVKDNTEYKSLRGEGGLLIGGDGMDWCFKEFHVPSFIFEILSEDYELFIFGGGKHDHLVHWMKTTVPFFMYLLVNIEKFHNWELPDIQPLLPEDVPPSPLK